MRDHLIIYLNGQPLHVRGEDAFLSLSDFLRRRKQLAGTKVVCSEGDCGSCSVLVGRVEGEGLKYAAVTSCIQMMFQLDATHVVSVEGLRDVETGGLNPIQDAMVQCHGAQCGFCTPGFVVAMYDVMRDGTPCDAKKVTRGLVGNLCRCTGYESIIRAALATDRTKLRPIDAMYLPAPIVAALAKAAAEEVLIETDRHRFCKPVTVESAVRFKDTNPTCVIVSGGTDVGVQINKRVRDVTIAMNTSGLTMLRGVTVKDGVMHEYGALATLTELEQASLQHLPELGEFLAWFGSPPIKNAGTLAGNLVNASPIGDTIPALMVLDAEVELAGVKGPRRVSINQFYTGYRKTVLAPDEIVTGVRIPLVKPGDTFRLYKVSKRKDLDISSFGAAIWMQLAGRTVADVRIAFGGVAATVVRMNKTESFLRGGTATLERFEEGGRIAQDEVKPITDVRGSDHYRRILCGNILVKFWHEAIGGNASNGRDVSGSPTGAGGVREPALARSPEPGGAS